MMTDSFAFVLNFYDYAGDLPLEVMPGVYLDRASSTQAQGIVNLLNQHGKSFAGGPWMYFVEALKAPPPGGFSYTQVPPGQAKFWVLNFSGNPTPVWDLCEAAQLTDSELEIAATFHPKRTDAVHQIDPPRMFHFSQEHIHPILQQLESDDLQSAASHYQRLRDFANASGDEAKATVTRIFQDFISLSAGQRHGHLPFLGHFALIEALITHDPRQHGDSLNHQLSTKMPLLMRRFCRPLELPSNFKVTDLRTLWKRLYEVRSIVAHGERADFTKGRLRELHDFNTVFKFVRASLKRLIIQSLQEPTLVFDLKIC